MESNGELWRALESYGEIQGSMKGYGLNMKHDQTRAMDIYGELW
jgi:hypothetical protein